MRRLQLRHSGHGRGARLLLRLGEATRGHNAVSSLIHAAAQQCDHTSEMEVPGLIPGTDLRPADVLTSALGNAYTALDVSICSPHASEAGVDCNQSRGPGQT